MKENWQTELTKSFLRFIYLHLLELSYKIIYNRLYDRLLIYRLWIWSLYIMMYTFRNNFFNSLSNSRLSWYWVRTYLYTGCPKFKCRYFESIEDCINVLRWKNEKFTFIYPYYLITASIIVCITYLRSNASNHWFWPIWL